MTELWGRGKKGATAPVVVRDLYPPRVADMDGRTNLLYFAWEESQVPGAWVDGFNRHLDGLCVLSRFVKKALMDSGVSVPITVGGCGIDQVMRPEREAYEGPLGKGFRFLHVSSTFPRKGIDALLKAYLSEFSASDDVTLIIKTFPNPHNTTPAQVAEARARPGCPEIVLINEDLTPGQLVDLYRRCHALVVPTRGEGFGLPFAEAMYFGLPVICTGFGGHLDFCTPETARLVDYAFARAQSHMGQYGSVWADPDVGDLARAMREVMTRPLEAKARAKRAKEVVERELRWDDCARRLEDTVEALSRVKPLRRGQPLRVAWMSSWNRRCGIAS
ncbi:MAG TPA: glycosyltransferase family 4 protein, partial [Gemmatimonadales bacterium]|nr:glycosyltransferase family 4 protein [Gemmatimonadales bacterium]